MRPEPAKLTSRLGVLRLAVERYQYPDAPPADDATDDANWLVTDIEWVGRHANFRLTDPALLAGELAALAAGLRRVADTLPDEERFAFVEPWLEFRCKRVDRLGHVEVTVLFGGEMAVGEWLRVEMIVDPSDLRRFAEQLRVWSTAYPERA